MVISLYPVLDYIDEYEIEKLLIDFEIDLIQIRGSPPIVYVQEFSVSFNAWTSLLE